MTVSLAKDASFLRWAQVRTPDFGSLYDLYDWEKATAPLWFDDASYARYQADDGPQGYWKTELNFRADDRGPIVSEWVWFNDDFDAPREVSLSRVERLAREIEQDAKAVQDEADRLAWLDALEEVPF